MKDFRRLCFAVVLAAVFNASALADPGATQGPPAPGDVHVPGAPAPAPGQTSTPPGAAGVTQGPGVAAFGDILTPGFAAILLALLDRP
jgi:hypothetical protein